MVNRPWSFFTKTQIMKRLIIILIALYGNIANAQNITAAEYFVDTDPGVGNGIAISVPAGTTSTFTASVPTVSLPMGFHFLAIRAKDATGKWGMLESRGFYISSSTATAANISAAEYFIDTDPGLGAGVALSIPSGSTSTFTTLIPTTSLAAGFHFIAIRVKDAAGNWGMFETRGFYISTSTANVGNITAAEFFIDSDPGAGAGTAVTIPSGGISTFTTLIPTSSLAAGFHFLAIRTRDLSGKWGFFETRGFYISTSTANAPNIVAAEYFFDTDPGVDAAIPLSIPAGATSSFTLSLPTTSLSPGFHRLAIRTKNASGGWGLFEQQFFYIRPAPVDMTVTVSGEYFFDTDPGLGNGMPFNFTTPGLTVTEALNLNVPAGTGQGAHTLVMRVKDANGFWGLFDTATFIVSGVIPLRFLDFNGRKQGKEALLNWTTENEINTSHFIIERSFNGFIFSSIGTISSLNRSGVNHYSFTDHSPLDGINFYRLKQVDKDGKFTYSPIVRILFSGYGKDLVLYPVPAIDKLNIDYAGKRNTVYITVYDAAGRQVMNSSMPNQSPLRLNVSTLPAGKYYVQLSDGETPAGGVFMKK